MVTGIRVMMVASSTGIQCERECFTQKFKKKKKNVKGSEKNRVRNSLNY
jgi:hypothetical protein